jgi:trehalose 6-phosphate phosphatase
MSTAVDERGGEIMDRPGTVLASPHEWALFLDIDGTLLGMAPTPDAVTVPIELPGLLRALADGLNGALAIVTGRRIVEADRLLAPVKLVASGVHGTELRYTPDAPVKMLAKPVPPDVIAMMRSVSQIAEGILVEQKGSGAAVHYRNAPLAQRAIESEVARIIGLCSYDLVLRRGRKVLEAVPRGFSKGHALIDLMGRPPFQGRRPLMIGDDVGDETALRAAEAANGMGFKVAGEHFAADEADFGGVKEVRTWLALLVERLARTRPEQRAAARASQA